jgi:hypothetical protein
VQPFNEARYQSGATLEAAKRGTLDSGPGEIRAGSFVFQQSAQTPCQIVGIVRTVNPDRIPIVYMLHDARYAGRDHRNPGPHPFDQLERRGVLSLFRAAARAQRDDTHGAAPHPIANLAGGPPTRKLDATSSLSGRSPLAQCMNILRSAIPDNDTADIRHSGQGVDKTLQSILRRQRADISGLEVVGCRRGLVRNGFASRAQPFPGTTIARTIQQAFVRPCRVQNAVDRTITLVLLVAQFPKLPRGCGQAGRRVFPGPRPPQKRPLGILQFKNKPERRTGRMP